MQLGPQHLHPGQNSQHVNPCTQQQGAVLVVAVETPQMALAGMASVEVVAQTEGAKNRLSAWAVAA